MDGRKKSWLAAAILALAIGSAVAQAPAPGPVASFRELKSVGLDASRVYRVRDATIDRQGLHLVFSDGTIALTKAVDGRITGAFFEGDGEVLVSPSTRVERASLALFSDAAILEEKFTTAYLRFNDETWKDFDNGRRDEAESQDFVARWNGVAQTLAVGDAFRLLRTWVDAPRSDDRFVRARLGTVHFGTLDVSWDASAYESISVAQVAHVEAGTFYDLWTQFKPGAARDEPVPRSRRIQISKYHIDAHIEPPHDLAADTELSLTSGQGGERLMSFELSRYLKVNSIAAVDGDRATPLDFIQNEALEGSQLARRGNDVVFVILPKPLSPGVPIRLKFTYAGPVLSEAGGGLMYVGARGIWYPNHGPEMADFDLEFRSPPEWVLLATGKRLASETKNGEQISHWVSEHPMPLAGFNLGRYDRVSAKAGSVTVTAYATRSVENNFVTNRRPPQPDVSLPLPPFGPTNRATSRLPIVELPTLPPDPLVHAKAVAEMSAHTIDWLAPKLGDFPFSTLALTQMPGTLSQGWPGLVFLSSYVFMAEEERTQRQLSPVNQLLYRQVVPIHETIHQWWGDEVAWRSYHDQWIVEAISNYLALMTLERDRPEAARNLLDYYRNELLNKVHDDEYATAGPVTMGVRLTSSKFPGAYEVISYGRGTWLIHMLREMLHDAAATGRGRVRDPRDSDELFFKALRNILDQNRYHAIGNAELQKAFEDVLPPSAQYEGRKSLDWFFDEWVNGTAIPHLELDDVKIALRGGRTVATGKIVQKDGPKTLVTCVPIYAQVATSIKPIPVGRVFADEEETSFRINVPPGTKRLVFDPNGTILTRP